MKSRFAVFLCVIAVFQLIGGHWAVLQATAWVGMLVKYSQSEGMEAGISKTFDGKHPCDLCLSIAKNKQTERSKARGLKFRQDILGCLRPALGSAASPRFLVLKVRQRFNAWLR